MLCSVAPLLTLTAVFTSEREPAKTTDAMLAAPVVGFVSVITLLVIDTLDLDAAVTWRSLPAVKLAPDFTSTCVVPDNCAKPAPKLAKAESPTCCCAPA